MPTTREPTESDTRADRAVKVPGMRTRQTWVPSSSVTWSRVTPPSDRAAPPWGASTAAWSWAASSPATGEAPGSAAGSAGAGSAADATVVVDEVGVVAGMEVDEVGVVGTEVVGASVVDAVVEVAAGSPPAATWVGVPP